MNIDIFNILHEPYQINNKIRLIELFAGVGSQAMALRNIGANFEHHRVVEFDKYAIASYNAIHNTNFETTDITKITGKDLGIIDTDQFTYIMTYSFPCQDLSTAGNRKGMSREDGTRSGLLWEVERLLKETEHKPQILLMENVPEVIEQANIDNFREWERFLEKLGYSNFINVLNAKDFEIPQNRRRAFMISILGEYSYNFPKIRGLSLTIKDVLEDDVEDRYYINNKRARELIRLLFEKGDLQEGNTVDSSINNHRKRDIANALTGADRGIVNHQAEGNAVVEKNVVGSLYCETSDRFFGRLNKEIRRTLKASNHDSGVLEIRQLGNITHNPKRSNPQTNRVYDEKGLAPTLNTMQGGNREPMIVASRGREKGQQLEPNNERISNCLTTVQKDNWLLDYYRIRKLTPKECWRLMGFTDQDFEKAQKVNSNTQLYKQAGNSIVVTVLEDIFKQLNIKGV